MSKLTTTKSPLQKLFDDAIKTQVAADKATARKTSVGNEMLALAQSADSLESFLESCAVVETAHKNSKRKDKTIPRCWTQAKSNLKAAMKLGIDAGDFNTESSLRKALNEKRNANKAAKEEAEKKEQEANKRPADALDIMLAQIATSFEGTDTSKRAELAALLEATVVDSMKAAAAQDSKEEKDVSEPAMDMDCQGMKVLRAINA